MNTKNKRNTPSIGENIPAGRESCRSTLQTEKGEELVNTANKQTNKKSYSYCGAVVGAMTKRRSGQGKEGVLHRSTGIIFREVVLQKADI